MCWQADTVNGKAKDIYETWPVAAVQLLGWSSLDHLYREGWVSSFLMCSSRSCEVCRIWEACSESVEIRKLIGGNSRLARNARYGLPCYSVGGMAASLTILWFQ